MNTIGQEPLTLDAFCDVVCGKAVVGLADGVRGRLEKNRAYIEKILTKNEPIYGVNTGFGKLARVHIANDDLKKLQENLIRSHCCGVGEPLSAEDVRGMMLLRANVLAQGYSGVRPAIVDRLLEYLNHGITPVIPRQGSVGASGDLAPLAHLALTLIGEGECFFEGRRLTTASILKKLHIKPLEIQAKEGIALLNGTQFMTAIGARLAVQARAIVDMADICGAVALEALMGSPRPFEDRLQKLRPHAGQQLSAYNLSVLLNNSKNIRSHEKCDKVQDPYSIRCMPQIHGASRDVLAHVESVLLTEMNSVTDNPLVFDEDDEILSCGNFHGQPVALALDYLAIALAEIGSVSERRVEQLVNPSLSQLPPFLTPNPGLNSGFMIAQVTAAALASENKIHAHPASIDSIPTSANQEDHVSMGSIAAVKLDRVVENVKFILSIELLAACQGLDLKKWIDPGEGVLAAYSVIRSRVKKIEDDRMLAPEFETVKQIAFSDEFFRAIHDACPKIVFRNPLRSSHVQDHICTSRIKTELQGLAARSRHADADEQSRSGSRRKSR